MPVQDNTKYNGLNVITPKVKSRPVEFKDLWRVIKASWKIKWAMLKPFPGRYPFAASVGHSQIEENDPLRFFVLDRQDMKIKLRQFFGARTIINPIITWESSKKIKSFEGCMSFPNDKIRPVMRREVVECEYWTVFGKKKRKFYVFRACLIQHELSHMDCVTIYDEWKHKNK